MVEAVVAAEGSRGVRRVEDLGVLEGEGGGEPETGRNGGGAALCFSSASFGDLLSRSGGHAGDVGRASVAAAAEAVVLGLILAEDLRNEWRCRRGGEVRDGDVGRTLSLAATCCGPRGEWYGSCESI